MNYKYRDLQSTITAAILAFISFQPAAVWAQETNTTTEVTTVQSLFEYPVAPDELPDIFAKSNWLMANFWNPMDFKSEKAVNQTALNHAFMVYVNAMRWATRDKALESVDNLIGKISKNRVLMLQFTKAAEENLYGARADYYIDEVYVKFLRALQKQKKLTELQKARYNRQLKLLENTMVGNIAPSFKFKKPNGDSGEYFPMSTLTIIEFGDPTCDDCRFAKLKMESNAAISRALTDGKLNVLFMMPDEPENFEEVAKEFPVRWSVGYAEGVDDIYDLRNTPSFYVIGTDGKIIAKNLPAEEAISTALNNLK